MIPPNHPFLRQLLDRMLRDNMEFSKEPVLPRRKRSKKEKEEDGKVADGDEGDGEENEAGLEFQEEDGEAVETEQIRWEKPSSQRLYTFFTSTVDSE